MMIIVVVLADVALFVVLSGSSSNINIFGCSQEFFFLSIYPVEFSDRALET